MRKTCILVRVFNCRCCHDNRSWFLDRFKNSTHLGLWRKLYNCSLHHIPKSQCILICVRREFSTTSNWLAEISGGGGLSDPARL